MSGPPGKGDIHLAVAVLAGKAVPIEGDGEVEAPHVVRAMKPAARPTELVVRRLAALAVDDLKRARFSDHTSSLPRQTRIA
jgi:hypothetical protein